jgi:hypothetical protein
VRLGLTFVYSRISGIGGLNLEKKESIGAIEVCFFRAVLGQSAVSFFASIPHGEKLRVVKININNIILINFLVFLYSIQRN